MYQLEYFSSPGLLATINNHFIIYRITEISEDGISVKLATSYTYCETSDLSLTFTGMVTECSFIPFNLPVNKQFDKNNVLALITIVVKLHCGTAIVLILHVSVMLRCGEKTIYSISIY